MAKLLDAAKQGFLRLKERIEPRLRHIKKKREDKEPLTQSEDEWVDGEGNIVDEEILVDELDRASDPDRAAAKLDERQAHTLKRLLSVGNGSGSGGARCSSKTRSQHRRARAASAMVDDMLRISIQYLLQCVTCLLHM